ncbi:MAG TPA: phosphopentomutase [Patescibacteria group bacterium]|nr:phosphopentomutase [Patescibacteria group bacterium]
MFKRILVIILDSVGIGELPDAGEFGDSGANTLGNIARYNGGLRVPAMEAMGLGCIAPLEGVRAVSDPIAMHGKMAELSRGKDTTSGHWEMAGCPVFTPFPVYSQGFPPEVISAFTQYSGLKVLGNKAASGTEIIAELGEEHMRTAYPIVYTSADSVFQIAAHEGVIPLTRLYELCRIAREQVCIGEHAVGRIIARPFIGEPGHFTRTANRHDYSVPPPSPTVLEQLTDAGHLVTGIGKISDIFATRGVGRSFSTRSNQHGMDIVLDLVRHDRTNGLVMANLVEFDSSYGHRNDVDGYARALEEFDSQLAVLLPHLQMSDLLIITADHGCDPTFPGTDHTREYVPLMAYTPGWQKNKKTGCTLGVRTSFADLGATLAENFAVAPLKYGTSFLDQLR